MIITYRRMSGAIGVTPKEKGARGLWFEKRLALFNYIASKGHSIQIYNRPTEASIGAFSEIGIDEAMQGSILMIEFGSGNKSFYPGDLEQTALICNNFRGRKIFLCDDPDLPMMWQNVKLDGKWSIWQNAKFRIPMNISQPKEIPIFDMPFSALQDSRPAGRSYNKNFVYIGRPDGRAKAVKDLVAYQAPWKVYGKQKEWDDYGVFVHDPPQQPARAEFYNQQLGSLVLADAKHKRLAWRTGRAYHAILAGCPALCEDLHPGLDGLPIYRSVADITRYKSIWTDPDERAKAVKEQQGLLLNDRFIANKTMSLAGL